MLLWLLAALPPGLGGELHVATDFPGASARVESIDQATKTVRFMPGGDPAHGWICWWYLRVDGTEVGEKVLLDLAGSDLPTRNNGTVTEKPLSASWAMPGRAVFSVDHGNTWQQTPPGRRADDRILYEVTAAGPSVLVAWGPPFTSAQAERLITEMEKAVPGEAQRFELCRTRADRVVPGIRIAGPGTALDEPKRFGIWIEARQHAWESGSSWVMQGLADWLAGADEDSRWLRANAEIFLVPILDVDNVETGNGGKEADPHDHNRDWSDKPIYPEVAASQARLRKLAEEGRLDLFINLHNPAPGDGRPFFFCGPVELLSSHAKRNRETFLAQSRAKIRSPLELASEPRTTGPGYHPLWRQISGQWVTDHGNPHTVSACLETPWNTPHSTVEGYGTVGRQLGEAIATYFRTNPRTPPQDP